MSSWFFQANPKMFDIDKALEQLTEIWWRVPQHTADIHHGDAVLLWRTGRESGIVGVGRVVGEPRQHASADHERNFILQAEVAARETRALVRVRATTFVSKDQVRTLPGFQNHLIIKAPMGTVIPISDVDYELLEPLVVSLPEIERSAETTGIPFPFAWEQRSGSAYSMPGAFDAYLVSLQTLIHRVQESRPSKPELARLIASEFGVSERNCNHLAAFLTKAGLVVREGETFVLSEWVRRWIESGDPRILVGLLHSRIRFIGEMLESAQSAKTSSEMLNIANGSYGCGWSTKAEVDFRRGWLQSAGMLAIDDSNRMVVTDAGLAMVSQLELHRPTLTIALPAPPEDAQPRPVDEITTASEGRPVDLLVGELRDASIESADPDRFERAVRDALAWLGFEAKWIGGSGNTDVLLDAPLGLDRSYRVIIDCKTSASGSVGDGQIDWITIAEHRHKHGANHAAVVAPSPSGRRLFERAKEQKVTIISVDELASLCEQHARAPLDLESYRTLFVTGGVVDTTPTAEQAEDWLRLTALGHLIIKTFALRSQRVGAMTAKELQLLLVDDAVAESASREDFQQVLDTLASPLLAVLKGSSSEGYRLTTPTQVASLRLEILARLLFAH